jgi:D-sedoheptulose 7-phosphate isomerase
MEKIQHLILSYPELDICQPDISMACELLVETFKHGNKLLVCGNGGSAADAEHIVGELMKGYLKRRPVAPEFRRELLLKYPQQGDYLADHLQGALPAISLVSQVALNTAFTNDVAADMIFAQQVYGYGVEGDALLALSTSGNAANVVNALQTARVKGMKTIGLTGQHGGRMVAFCDVAIRVPWNETPKIQERHLPIYHAICEFLEAEFFAE